MATDETSRVTRARRAASLRGIYAIVNEGEPDPVVLAHACVTAGIRIVQYRAKQGIVPEHVQRIRALTRDVGALLIMNDDWRAARAFVCDGVHLGPDDAGFANIPDVRAEFTDGLIGVSCGTVEEARAVYAADVDYIGVGSVYATASKADAGEPIGVDGLRRVASASTYPVAAIGGITSARLGEIRAAGVAMAAVIAAIAEASDPYEAARGLVRLWEAEGVRVG